MKKKIPLHWKIIIGMILGALAGLLCTTIEGGSKFIFNWIKPLGNIFIKALKLIAVPLILASLVKGISDLKDIYKLSVMGIRTISIYVVTTLVAVSIGLILVNLIKPGDMISEASRESLLSEYATESSSKISSATNQKNTPALQPLEDIVPENIFGASSDNGNMLQVIFFAILMGVAMILIPKKKAKPVKKFFDSLNEIVLKIIDIIMLSAPYGIFALIASLVAQAPKLDIFKALGAYAFTVVLGLIILMLFYGILVKVICKIPMGSFFRGMAPAQLLAFSTSSSAATLPVTKEQVEKKIGVHEDVSSFVLPIGATINMDGTSLYQGVAAIFIAQSMGMHLGFQAQLAILATATLSSIGSAAVPGAGIVMLIIVLTQAGIPEAGIGLILAIDRPLDMCRTVINVTGDATVSSIIAKKLKMLNFKS